MLILTIIILVAANLFISHCVVKAILTSMDAKFESFREELFNDLEDAREATKRHLERNFEYGMAED